MAIYGRRQPHRPLVARYISAAQPFAVGTPNYTGYVVTARDRRFHPRPQILYAKPVIGAAPPSVAVPRYMGLFVRPMARPRTQYRHRLARFRFTPAGGFVGAKLGFLTVTPTRKATGFTVAPTRQANLTVQ